MTFIQALVLGAVQGATEFIPVSSTGHLIVVPWLVGWDDGGLAFDLATHVGTLIAVIWYFWRDWVTVYSSLARLILNPKGCDPQTRQNGMIGIYILVGCIPAGVIGIFFGDFVEEVLRSHLVVATSLIVVAFVMLAADRFGRKERGWTSAGLKDWIIVGIAQAIALIPGVSRSGITICAGLGIGLERPAAARISFLLSAPVIFGAAMLHVPQAIAEGLSPSEIQGFIVGTITAGIVGYLSIKFLLNFLKAHGFGVFVAYRIALALVILGLAQYRGQ